MSQSELEDFEDRILWHNRHLEAAGVKDLIFVGDGGVYNIGVYSMTTHKAEWFSDFEPAEAYCMGLYPDAYWETTGWQKNL